MRCATRRWRVSSRFALAIQWVTARFMPGGSVGFTRVCYLLEEPYMGRSLAGSRVLVLGGSSGIGLATAKAAAAGGAKVTLASRSTDKVDAALEAFFSTQPEWDHIVVSVAAGRSAGLHDLSLQDAYGNMNAKLWTAYKTARLARITPDGSLTLVSGYLSQRPNKDALLQGCINAALESLGRGLALALSPVRVNTVSPGLIDT